MDPWSRRGAWLSLGLLLVACSGVLGIEERKLDSADSYPVEGYDGCRPGAGCEGCLDVHEKECQVRSVCIDSAGARDCVGCVCDNCLEPVVDCQLDAGCDAIWQCLRQTRCDLSERGANSCQDECGSVIQSHGGVNGAAFQAAAGIRSCAVGASCLTCLAPQPVQPTCNQANGCQDCGGCFQTCLCSGETYGACRDYCDDAPADSCTPENSCDGCADCIEACTCGGTTFAECSVTCQPDPEPIATCTLETGCTDCADDCVATCVCSGGDLAFCRTECAPPAPDDVCAQDNLGSESTQCGGCQSRLAQCTCRGYALEACMDDSGLSACCVARTCGLGLTNCTCDGESADSCAGNVCDSASSCDSCVCRNCPGTYALCQQTEGCTAIFECMRSTNCHGSECQERCSSVNPDISASEPFDVAEALWSCHQGNQCTCTNTEPPVTLTCIGPDGAVECAGYNSNGVTIAACCPTTILTTKAGGSGSLGSASCGLEMQSYLPDALPCEPKAQPREPAAVLGCPPSDPIRTQPYNGATLEGCCNEADSTCGYYDNVTGLGCLRASAFGSSDLQNCPLIYL